MNRRLPIALAFIVLVGALAGSAWLGWQEHQQILVLQAQLKSTDLKLTAAKKQAAGYHDRLVEAAQKRAEARKAGQSQLAGDAKIGPNKDGPVDLRPYLEKLPGYAQLHQLQMLKQVARQYGDLKELNLPPDQLNKLRNLLAEKMQSPQDAREAALQAGIAPNSPEMTRAMRDAMTSVDSEIKALVGDDQFTAVNNLQMQSGYRNSIQYQYGSDLTAAGIPLTTDQLNALAQAQQQAQQTLMQTIRNNGGAGGVNFQQVMNQAIADQATKVLTPDQLQIFQQSLSVSTQMAELQNKARAAAQQDLGHPIHSWTGMGF